MWLANGHTARGFHGRLHDCRQRVACSLHRVYGSCQRVAYGHHRGNGGCGIDASYRYHGDRCSHCGSNHLIDNHQRSRGICYVDHTVNNYHRSVDDIAKRDA